MTLEMRMLMRSDRAAKQYTIGYLKITATYWFGAGSVCFERVSPPVQGGVLADSEWSIS